MLEERVKDGDTEAKWMLGVCCEYGIGIEQDIERAVLLYQQSSEGGNVVGELLLENGRYDRGSEMMMINWGLWKDILSEMIAQQRRHRCLNMSSDRRRGEKT